MFKTLVYKQFYECFRGYFVDTKTGKRFPKKKTVLKFCLFGLLLLFLSATFFVMGFALEPLAEAGYNWLYFTLFGILSISLGVFACVFSTSSALYLAKDNDLLISMPIKNRDILLSRLTLVAGLALMYSSIMWFPAILFYWIFIEINALNVIFTILLQIVMVLLITAIACAIGYIVAVISSSVKNRSFITVVITLIFLGVYYFFCFSLSDYIDSIVENSAVFADKIISWVNFMYQFGKAATGDILAFAIFSCICIGLFSLCIYILDKSFVKIVNRFKNVKVIKKEVKFSKQVSTRSTLLRKEFKRFTSLPTYMLNAGLGVIFMIALSVIGLVKRNDLDIILPLLEEELPIIMKYLPLSVISAISLIAGMNQIVTPSISLEGKNIWILKSLPIKTEDILKAKESVQLYVNCIPIVLSSIVLCYCLKLPYSMTITVCLINLFIEIAVTHIDLLIGLLKCDLNWTSEVQPIKQNVSILYGMIVSLLFTVMVVGGYFLLTKYTNIEIDSYLQYCEIVLILITLGLQKLVYTKGVELFDKL